MCDDFKSLTGITLSPSQLDDPRVLKFWTDAGAISSCYAQIQRTINDFFPQTASDSALLLHLAARGLPDQIQPGKSHGQIQFTVTGGTTIKVGTQVQRVSDGALFQTIQSASPVAAGNVTLFVESIATGNSQNLDQLSQPFALVQPVPNVNTNCTNVSLFFDGRDLESSAEMLARIQAHDRDENSGGNAVAYEAWAKAGSSEVVTAKCLRRLRGPDSVDIIITAGTTDIAAAVNGGQPVTRLPSSALIDTVQAYINLQNPVTDDVLVRAPTETPFNITFNYALYTDTTANRAFVDAQILKIIKIYLYSAKPLDVLSPTALERLVDQSIGSLISGRECSPLGMSTSTYIVPQDQILSPGTITLGTLT
jgi:uncharacterized phage protein gp47/JayE